jgi:Tol biopolymer transport system component
LQIGGFVAFISGSLSKGGSAVAAVLRRLSVLLLASLLLAGCSPATREDRTITFAPDGKQVAFQHDRDGIFIAETEGAAPTKIFQPDADVIAVGTPLWNPVDKRLIFTTAKKAGKDSDGRGFLPAEPDPAGDLHSATPTVYTCWLRTEPKRGQPLVVPIFTAHCDHPGYVAANLAVRWHPDGQHVLYIKQDDQGRHGLFAYDLQTNSSRQVCPRTGAALVFDWAPDNTHLVCVFGGRATPSENDGIWIGRPGDDDWWHVPDSAELGGGELDHLRAARPVWARDGNRFAFISTHKNKDNSSAVHRLHLAALDTRTVKTLVELDKPVRDIHWHPDGSRLGFLCGGDTASFHLADVAEKRERAVGAKNLCNFLGWDAAGEQLAFVARQPLTQDPAQSWTFLFLPDVRARNLVLVAPDADPARTRTVFSGLQVTFPQWSPKESKLSLWATFRPTYRSWLSHLLDLGGDAPDPLRGLILQPGDPALVLDPATGERSWKAINAREKMQVGHYHLLHREYDEAWRCYEQAAAGAPDVDDRSPQQFVRRFVRGRDGLFFQAYCLQKLGREADARRKHQQFEETFLPELPAPPKAPAPGELAPFGAAGTQPTKEQLLHWRDLYIAEVFLSLDATEDGERFFRDGLKAAQSDADRLSKALVLTQFLLLRNQHAEYAELATDTVLPLLLRTWKPRKQTGIPPNQQANFVLAYSDGLSLLPLFAPEYLAGLSEKQVRDLVPRWQKLRPAADDDVKRLGIDLFLEAAARRLGQADEQRAAARRVADNPAKEILGDKGVTGLIEGVRAAPEAFEDARQMMASIR